MATLSIGKAHFTIGAHDNDYSQEGNLERPGSISGLSRFMTSAQGVADEYADFKYTQTDWRAIRP